MAGERTLPGLGLKAFWTLGSNGWKPDMDQDLFTLSVAVQGRVLDMVDGASLPGSPTDGMIYIITDGPEAQHLIVRDDGAWVYVVPLSGWFIFNIADGKHYVFDGAAWNVIDYSLYQLLSEKGAINGYASLNASGQVPASQLPGGSDVVNYPNLAAFPGTGAIGTVYVADDTDTSYLWDDDALVYVAMTSTGTLPSTVGFKSPCRLVATTNVDITTGGVVSVDGKNTATGYRVLLTAQTAPAENGIYVANSAGAWTRATDANTVAEVRGGLVTVWQGTTYGSSVWFTTFKQGNTLGTTAMNWYQVAHGDNIIDLIDTLLGGSGWQTGGSGPADTDALTEGSTNLYFTEARVLGTDLAGLSTASEAVVVATDTVLAAIGQLQAQLSSKIGKPFELLVAVSDETTALTVGAGKVTFRMPAKVTLSSVRASVTTAPTGSTITVDINEGGVTILSTKLTIDATEKTSTTAATAAVISDTSLADDAEITIDVDAVGSTVAGAGLKVLFLGVYAA